MDETFRDSRGSFRKTSVIPFCREKTNMIKADNLMSDRVIWSGIVRPELVMLVSFHQNSFINITYAAASGCGEVNDGFVDR